MRKLIVLLTALLTAASFVSCSYQGDETLAAPQQSGSSSSESLHDLSEIDGTATQPIETWSGAALFTELYGASSYTAVYSQLIDTYLIACGLYWDFDNEFIFSMDNSVDYQETIAHFTPYKSHRFIQELGPYLYEPFADSGLDVISNLMIHAVSVKETGAGIHNIQSAVFPNDETFSVFLNQLGAFYLDAGAGAFFKESNLHNQLAQYVDSTIDTVPVAAYLDHVERYTGTKDKVFGSNHVHYMTLFSSYKSPYNATFHRVDMAGDTYLISLQSPLGFEGCLNLTQAIETTVHESLHPFINPGVAQQKELIDSLASGKNTGDYTAPMYARLPWHRITDEAIVRVVQARIYGDFARDYEKAKQQVLEKEVQSGFANLYAMFDVLEDYESNRDIYPQIDDFLPVIIAEYFDGES